MDDNSRKAIHIIVKNKNGIIMEDDVFAISSYNQIGIFDVLPLHTNFISLIRKKLTIHKGHENKDIDIGVGLLRVIQNQVHIYLGLPDPDEANNPTNKTVEIKTS